MKISPDPALLVAVALQVGENVQPGEPIPPKLRAALERRYGHSAVKFAAEYRAHRDLMRPHRNEVKP
jgi:hypothetical protein